MNDVWLSRMIIGGLISLAWGALIVACCYGYGGQDVPQWVGNAIATISGGLLGYVTNNVVNREPSGIK